jgi:hypothetical protein
MRTTRVSFDRHNLRRDHRYPLPALTITIDGAEYTTANWSLGGFAITGFDQPIAPGKSVTGQLCLADQTAGFAFTATVVRIGEPEPGQLAVQFTDLGENGLSVLERIITRRLFRG